jgi:catechol 2,3-dioxygenase
MTESQLAAYGRRPPGYRLPADTRLGRVRFQIADLTRSLAYYTGLLGFRVIERDGRLARLGAHEDDRVLVELHEEPGVQPVPRRGLLGLFHVAILLPDRAALGRFVGHLATARAHVGMADHAVSEALYLTDPDGLGLEVYADRPRDHWQTVGDQLYMTTEPLDVPDLVAAAHGEPWTGMPHGTTIGHVHLHVGDLDGSAAFYHRALGFDETVWSYPGALFLAAGGYHHHLGTNTWAGNAPPAGPRDARLLSWDIVIDRDAIDLAGKSLVAGGYAITPEASGVSTQDPWGTTVRLVEA